MRKNKPSDKLKQAMTNLALVSPPSGVVITTPNHAKVRFYALLWIACSIILMLFFDQQITGYLQSQEWIIHNRKAVYFNFFDTLGRPRYWLYGSVLILLAMSFLLYFKPTSHRRRLLVRYSGRLFFAVLYTWVVADILNTIFGRARPRLVNSDTGVTALTFHLLDGNILKYASFPAATAASAMAVAFACYFLHPKSYFNYIIFILAFLISLQQFLVLEHYISDIFLGWFLGGSMAYYAAYSWQKFIRIGEE